MSMVNLANVLYHIHLRFLPALVVFGRSRHSLFKNAGPCSITLSRKQILLLHGVTHTPILCYKATKVSSLFSPWFEVHLPSDLLHRKVHPFSSDTIQQILRFRRYWVQWGHQLQSLERQDFGPLISYHELWFTTSKDVKWKSCTISVTEYYWV